MNRKLLTIATVLATVAAPAMAETINVGDLYGLNGTDAYVNGAQYRGGPGSVDTSYSFTLSHSSVVHMSLTDTARLSGLQASLYSVSSPTPVTVVGPLNGTAASGSWQSETAMSAGNYRVDVIGSYLTRGSYSLELSSDVAAPVPGPAGFIVAGAGALVLAARRRRKTKTQAALA